MAILDVDTRSQEGLVHIVLKGELDMSSTGKVERELARAEEDAVAVIALDLSGLSFLDSSGLRAIVGADKRARRENRRFVVVRGSDTVHRVFTITHLDTQLEIIDDLASLTSDAEI